VSTDAKAFLGKGWGFPLAVDASGELATASYEADIDQSIRIILGTEPGERMMLPAFGCGLRALVFEPINTTTMSLAQFRVQQALTLWEPRIDSIGVSVTAPAPQLGQLLIQVSYRVRTTNTFYNLVYPFYLQEGQASD
jgi:Bacteriophage baseplate protein W